MIMIMIMIMIIITIITTTITTTITTSSTVDNRRPTWTPIALDQRKRPNITLATASFRRLHTVAAAIPVVIPGGGA